MLIGASLINSLYKQTLNISQINNLKKTLLKNLSFSKQILIKNSLMFGVSFDFSKIKIYLSASPVQAFQNIHIYPPRIQLSLLNC